MPTPVPEVFRKSPVINANYDYVDVAEGTGVVVFNLCYTETSSGEQYLLTSQSPYSAQMGIVTSSTVTRNFDAIAFNMPKVIKGTAYLNVGHYVLSNGAESYVKVKIIKVSGGVATDCSSQISSAQLNSNGVHRMHLIPIALTETNFERGDILRCEIILNSSNNDVEVGADPMGRDGTYITSALTSPTMTTKSRLFMPFRIDI